MSLLINGELRPGWLEKETADGEFIRMDSQFRHWITPDGAPGVSGRGGFPAEAGRYHLYVSLACPWAHRTLIFRKLKQLEDVIDVSVVNPDMDEQGWSFLPHAGSTEDCVNGFTYLHQAYTMADKTYTGIVTVPVLWDKKRQTIVNNESSEIIRMFNSAFNHLTGNRLDFYPQHLRMEIDAVNADIYGNINNGVYRCGFAQTQTAYERAFDDLFDCMARVEKRLAQSRYITGTELTEADWRLFPTLVRFDPVYYSHFKCNLQRVADYPNLSHFLRDLYQMPGIAETVHIEQIKRHYYWSHTSINPSRIVPKGPRLDYHAPHNRGRFAVV